ncbi:MAG TPA: cytochrome c biogenesis CcdA family protein [Nitrolancea sp.]|nr:cytochrome c biogenesis CcdA family protein [Nitrolancea sp.]
MPDSMSTHHQAIRGLFPPNVSVRRRYLALTAVVLVLALAVVAALLTGTQQSSVTGSVEHASSSGTSFLRDLSIALPFGYAFGAGMVAAVNPCGFALLPAYLGLYLGDQNDSEIRSRWSRLLRALVIGAAVTLGFVVLFGVTGLILSSVTTTLTNVFPWLGLIVGVALVLLAGRLMVAEGIYSGLGERLAARVTGLARGSNVAGYFAYGVGYGLASLSCTLPIFLALAGGSLTAGRFVSSLSEYVLFGLGMGAVITLLTLATALFKAAAVRRVRHLSRYVQPMSAALLLVAGGYIVYYWLTLGGLLGMVR